MSKFAIAMMIYAVLGLLAWQTLPDEKIRLVTLAVLGLFAVKTILHHHREALDAKYEAHGGQEQSEPSGSPQARS